ncbi:MAG TPA: hypothetical protein VHB77_05450 [Planctomycetaceae bacterium]|nr:hypothetical protein [Planctomycetaceae bacterium]
MAVRRVIGWMLVGLLLAGAAGGAYAYRLLTHVDDMLRAKIVDGLGEMLPGWNLQIGRCRFDLRGHVRVYDVQLRVGQDQPLVQLPEVVIVVDRDQLADQRVLIHQIRLLRPEVFVSRDVAGKWNFEDLPPLPPLRDSASEWKIEQGSVNIRLERVNADPDEIVLREINTQFVPSGKRRFEFRAAGIVDRAGAVSLEGQCNLDDKTWNTSGHVQQLRLNSELLQLAGAVSPEIPRQVHAAMHRLHNRLKLPPPTTAPEDTPVLGIDATTDVHFRVSQRRADSEREYQVLLNVSSGRIENACLPFPLEGLKAKLYCDNRQLLVRQFSARNGATQIGLTGKLGWQSTAAPGRFELVVRNLSLDARVRSRLTKHLQDTFDSVQPAGKVDLESTLQVVNGGEWKATSTVHFKDCTGSHVKFPYRVEGITGTIHCEDGVCDFDLQGFAGRRPATLVGRTQGPSDTGEAHFEIRVSRMPFDDKLLGALNPTMRGVVEALNIDGSADAIYALHREAGQHEFQPHLVVLPRDCSLNYKLFQYRVSGISGRAVYDGRNWTFEDLQGEHGACRLAAAGQYRMLHDSGQLDLRIASADGEFDKSLFQALPNDWRRVWGELSPSGKFHANTVIRWVPGQSPWIGIDLVLAEAGVVVRTFPYALERLKGKIHFADGRADIDRIVGFHEDTPVDFKGWAEINAQGEWRVRLDELQVDDLNPDRRFRSALPTALREVVDNLDPRGPVTLSGMLDFRGTGNAEDYGTAAWDIEAVVAGSKITTGVDVSDLHGRIAMRGTWDGHDQRLKSTGRLDLDSLTILGYQFTKVRGPFSIEGNHLVIGSQEAVNMAGQPGSNMRTSAEDRVTARAIDGLFTLDGIAVLDKQTSYRVLITMNGARLERYAQLYRRSPDQLQGIMNGWCELSGRGNSAQRIDGRGQLQIAPAALYELPVMVAIFNVLKSPDKTAFNRAFVQFEIGGSQFLLKQISLTGNSISFRGDGYVRFDRKLYLDLYSTVTRNQRMAVPVIQSLFSETMDGWVGIEVRGTVDHPQVEFKPAPKIDDALKRLFGGGDDRPQMPPARQAFPATGAPR